MGRSENWHTPQYIFDAMNTHFDQDVAAPPGGPRYVPCDEYICENSLDREWKGFIWMNPPFGHQQQKLLWLRKFMQHGNGVALMPDRTSAPWWQELVPKSDVVLFVSPKIKFERDDGSLGEAPGDGTTLIAKGTVGVGALISGNENGLGEIFIPFNIRG